MGIGESAILVEGSLNTKRMRKGNVLPVAIGAFAVVAFLFMIAWAVTPNLKWPWSTKTTPTNTVVVNTSVNTNITNTNSTGSNVNSTNNNTNTSSAAYTSPDGPFDIGANALLAVSYRKNSDRLISRLAKINPTTGKAVATTTLKLSDIQSEADLPALPYSPTFIDFGRDGDSIVFLASSSSQSDPYVGIFRTSFSNPSQIETVLKYDRHHLFNDDIPSISSMRFSAQENTVAFVISGDNGQMNNFVKSVDLADGTVHDLKTYPTAPTIVSFPRDGERLEVLWTTNTTYTQTPKDKWYYDILDLPSGQLVTSKLLVDEANSSVQQQLNLVPDSISPNNLAVAVGIYDREQSQSVLLTRSLSTGKYVKVSIENFYGSNVLWSNDSGQVVLQAGSKEMIYDLAKGPQDTISGMSSQILWYPGRFIIFSDPNGHLYSYNPTTKKNTELAKDLSIQAYGGGGYGGDGSSFSLNWVNR